jgi:shikimate kinase
MNGGLRGHVVLVGHRGAGKTTLLAPLAERLGRPAVDLDVLIASRAGSSARALFERSEAAFRAAEREAFLSVGSPSVIAAGGGFLSHHRDLLEGHTPVLVPIDFETYRRRMLADTSRPRLRPQLSVEEEIASVFSEREALHAAVPTMPLSLLLERLEVIP